MPHYWMGISSIFLASLSICQDKKSPMPLEQRYVVHRLLFSLFSVLPCSRLNYKLGTIVFSNPVKANLYDKTTSTDISLLVQQMSSASTPIQASRYVVVSLSQLKHIYQIKENILILLYNVFQSQSCPRHGFSRPIPRPFGAEVTEAGFPNTFQPQVKIWNSICPKSSASFSPSFTLCSGFPEVQDPEFLSLYLLPSLCPHHRPHPVVSQGPSPLLKSKDYSFWTPRSPRLVSAQVSGPKNCW